MPIFTPCQRCGKTIQCSPSRIKQFCSNECYNADKQEKHRMQVTCIICGTTIDVMISKGIEQSTCRAPECIKAFRATKEFKPNYGQRKYTFTCPQCNKEVRTFNKRLRYCSKECRYAHTHVQKPCVICGKMFEISAGYVDRLVTCGSKECKKAIKSGEHAPFYGHEHSDTSKALISKANSKPRTEVTCTCGCGEKFELPGHRTRRNKSNMFFVDREHMYKWVIGENHWNYCGGNIYYGDGWMKIAQSIRERDQVCQKCGKTPRDNGRALDVHHKIPARISRDNSPENLIALCMSCHHAINVLEQYDYPLKVSKYRVCLVCEKTFTPEPFQKFCSDECRRKRVRQWEKRHLDTHPLAYQAYRQRIKRWQQINKDRVNESHQRSRRRRQ